MGVSTRRTLPTRADGKASNRFVPKSPKPKAPADTRTADVSDLAGKSAAELKEIAECAALRALIQQVRKPTRHATAVTSAARSLLDFSSAKPAQKIETDNTQRMAGEITISLIAAKEGRRAE